MLKFYVILLYLNCISIVSLAQKRILREAARFEQAELYEEAAEKYMEALHRNAIRPESIQGLKRNAQKVVDQMLAEYFVSRNSEEVSQAIEQFESINDYQEQLDYFKVEVSIPDYYYQDFESDKKVHLEALKSEVALLLSSGQKEKGKELIAEIRLYDPGFDPKTDLNENELIDPIYLKAIADFENGNLMASWKGFQEVLSYHSSYKKTREYLNKMKVKATTVAVISSEKNTAHSSEAIRDLVVVNLARNNHPLIRIIDRENLDLLIEEQKLGLSGIIDERSAAELGKILGVKAVIILKVLDYNFVKGNLNESSGTAYVASKKFVSDPVAQVNSYVTDYKLVQYTEFSKKNLFQASLQYQLISTETAEVLSSNILREEYYDDLSYAEYRGNHRLLFPSDGKLIYTEGAEYEAFQKLFSNNRTALSRKEMEYKVRQSIASQATKSVEAYYGK
ncbi:MAG: CsgG/HfaB family protein [Bacteroidota bacterium]